MPEAEPAGYWTRKLEQLGLELPTVVPPVANYAPAVRTGCPGCRPYERHWG